MDLASRIAIGLPQMELTLGFSGVLPSPKSGGTRLKEKHAIRQKFHEQLKFFWAGDTRLNQIKISQLRVPKKDGHYFNVPRPLRGSDDFFWRLPLCGYNFVPLVTHIHELHCHVDVRLFRRQKLGNIVFDGGDLDNRLKPLFDALRMPHDKSEIPESAHRIRKTKEINWPVFHCLLEDDSLITKFTIESFKMLHKPPKLVHPDNYVEMDIDISITPASPILGNIALLFP